MSTHDDAHPSPRTHRRARRALRATATLLCALAFAASASAQSRRPPSDVIREMQMNERYPSAGWITVELSDGATAEVALTVYGELNAPLDRSFLSDRSALRAAILEAIGDRSCDTLEEPTVHSALRVAVQALMDRPQELGTVSLTVRRCEPPLLMSLPE